MLDMTERPILFSGSMVRALLAGRKTQTRRVVKPQPPATAQDAGVIGSGNPESNGLWSWLDSTDLEWASQIGDDFRCPYGVPGDTLWVRETWGINDWKHGGRNPIPKSRPVDLYADALTYKATEDDAEILHEMPFRPSIHMPRWASRLTLEITDIRVERLQGISHADAKAEGCEPVHMQPGGPSGDPSAGWLCYREGYAALWDSINGKGSWATNPWVWAVSFVVQARP